jgi:mono/diheme cytochrome c family protein
LSERTADHLAAASCVDPHAGQAANPHDWRIPVPGVPISAVALLIAAAPADWNRVVAALQLVAEEHHETLEIADGEARRQRQEELARLLDEVAPVVPSPDVRRQVEALRARLVGADYEVGPTARALIRQILEREPVQRTPRAKPDLARGKRLYARSCAACHGPTATGDSAIGAALDPPARDILHPRQNWSPYDMFNRVTYGGAQTAMPSFETGLTDLETWDIVFYLFAGRWPPCTQRLPPLRADELAVLGDYELSKKSGYGAAACLRRKFLPPAQPVTQKRPAGATP